MVANPFEQARRDKALLVVAVPMNPTAPPAEVEAPEQPAAELPEAGPVHIQGFQHLFERARRYQELIDSDHVRSDSDVAHMEGVSPAPVGQFMHLLHLAPPIVAILDVSQALGEGDGGEIEPSPNAKATAVRKSALLGTSGLFPRRMSAHVRKYPDMGGHGRTWADITGYMTTEEQCPRR